jgi:hypothetical protein
MPSFSRRRVWAVPVAVLTLAAAAAEWTFQTGVAASIS